MKSPSKKRNKETARHSRVCPGENRDDLFGLVGWSALPAWISVCAMMSLKVEGNRIPMLVILSPGLVHAAVIAFLAFACMFEAFAVRRLPVDPEPKPMPVETYLAVVDMNPEISALDTPQRKFVAVIGDPKALASSN